MAITPKEAKKLSEKELKEMKVVEKIIDSQLAKGGHGSRSVPVVIFPPKEYMSDLSFPNQKVLNNVLSKYRTKWDVNHHRGNFRDPTDTDDYYEFTPKE